MAAETDGGGGGLHAAICQGQSGGDDNDLDLVSVNDANGKCECKAVNGIICVRSANGQFFL